MARKKWELTPFGKAIKKGIVDKGISHTELASEVGTTLQFLGHIMYGRKPGNDYIYKIAKFLDIDINEFIA